MLKFSRAGDIWGLSEIGVGGNDLFRSSGVRTYNERISASRFEVMIDASSILSSFLWVEADITVPTQGAPSDDAKLVQLLLGIFVGKRIFHVSAVRSCIMTCEPQPGFDSCGIGGGASDISKISLSGAEGACSLGNSTLALVLSGSSRAFPAMLL